MKTLENPVIVDVTFDPAHYTRNCDCMIPAAWAARVISGIPEIDDFGYPKYRIYTTGENRDEALSLLGRELHEFGYTGKMRVL